MNKIYSILLLIIWMGCSSNENKVQWITLDPGHFHAALVQKTMYDEIDSEVHVYAPPTKDLKLHLERIESYNQRMKNPTSWKTIVYDKQDFLKEIYRKEKGGIVMLSGNNQKKTAYILEAIQNGFHVFADKPMIIEPNEYELLEEAFELAQTKKLMLYDIMTERFEITTILQKKLSQQKAVFGKLIKGSPENPAIVKSSTHHYSKQVSGKQLIRPAWFFDVQQQGEGLVDVSSHLVDLTFWECFPEQAISKEDIRLIKAERWATPLTKTNFKKLTELEDYPDYLKHSLKKDTLFVFANGSMDYTLRGHHAKVEVIWNFEAPENSGDTHYSIMRGSKANLEIVQTKKEGYTPTLYITPKDEFKFHALQSSIEELSKTYPGIKLLQENERWKVYLPNELREGHEAHFAQVTKRFLEFYKNQEIPNWETTNMLTKYYLTTNALILAKQPIQF